MSSQFEYRSVRRVSSTIQRQGIIPCSRANTSNLETFCVSPAFMLEIIFRVKS
jgi:hypothetical protein